MTMQNNDDGGQAFPAYRGFDAKPPHVPGMTLRDYFAAKAMAGMLASGNENNLAFIYAEGNALSWSGFSYPQQLAGLSYAMADAMLAARK